MAFSLDKDSVASLAPDAASEKAANQLASSDKGWLKLGALDTEAGEVVWSEYQGSSGAPYHTHVELETPNFHCTCPSRKQPCKHGLALLLRRAESPQAFNSPPPVWLDLDGGSAPSASLELPESWQPVLGAELQKPYFVQLKEFLEQERATHTVYPPAGQEFAALQATPYDQVRVFILGQDPYHGPGQAHGMAFSVQPGVPAPPSLKNIFAEIQSEFGYPVPRTGYLMDWAKQGVLLLNAVLTVRRGEANSHKNKGWEKFTDAVIRAVNEKKEPVVFVLWGAYAQKKEQLIDTSRHIVVKSAHPSPLSAHNGFFGSRPFSQINAALQKIRRGEIDWRLSDS